MVELRFVPVDLVLYHAGVRVFPAVRLGVITSSAVRAMLLIRRPVVLENSIEQRRGVSSDACVVAMADRFSS